MSTRWAIETFRPSVGGWRRCSPRGLRRSTASPRPCPPSQSRRPPPSSATAPPPHSGESAGPAAARSTSPCPARAAPASGSAATSPPCPPDEVTIDEGIPVTTVPRTIFDLAATASPDEVEFALREAEYRQLHDALSLHDLLARYPGRRGARTVRRALDSLREASGRVESPLEEVFVPFLRRHHLPRPQLNAWLEAGGKRYRVDCLWPSTRQIVELDGWEGHRTRSAFRSDRARDRRLAVAGFSITRLTWSQLEDEPTAVAADLRTLLGAL